MASETSCTPVVEGSSGKCNSPTLFRVLIRKWPSFLGVKDARKFLKKANLEARKICPVGDRVFVTFENEESCKLAVERLNGCQVKGRNVRVTMASSDWSKSERGVQALRDESDLPENICQSVTPWHDVDYEEQLSRKQNDVASTLRSVIGTLDDRDVLQAIKGSPQVDGYRNKCEFTIGFGQGGQREIGFRLAKHRACCLVAPVDDCRHVPSAMKVVVAYFRDNVLLPSGRPPYDVDNRQGFWRSLTVRCYSIDIMLVVTVCPSGVGEEEMQVEKENLLSQLLYQDLTAFRVSSLYFQTLINSSDDSKYQFLGGCPYVYENLFKWRFRISPSSFFQVNTKACEVMYQAVGDEVERAGCDTLLDICCGTGSIGICMAARVARVIGVEVVPEAIEDAKENVVMNKIGNCQFVCDKAERYISQITCSDELQNSKCVVVLNPPRAGIGNKVIVALRCCPNVTHLIYLSCQPKLAKKNFVDLCRVRSKRYGGEPFQLSKVIPVDMLPHTDKYELVMLFTRKLAPNVEEEGDDLSTASQDSVESNPA